MEELLKEINGLKKRVAELEGQVQAQLKNKGKILDIALKILITLAIFTTIVNVITTEHYNQLILKEKTFLSHGEKVLTSIEENNSIKK